MVGTMRRLLKATLIYSAMIVLMLTVPQLSSAQTAIIYIDPEKSYPEIESYFKVNVSIAEVIDLHAWQLRIAFDPEIIQCENVSVPSYNIFGGSANFPDPIINNTSGYLKAFCGLWEPETGVDGSGLLCEIEFYCRGHGITPIIIADRMQLTGTYLVDPETPPNLIPFEAREGIAEVGDPGFQEHTFSVAPHNVIIFSNSTTVDTFDYDQDLKNMTFDVEGQGGTIGFCSVMVSKELLDGTLIVLANDDAIDSTLFENTTHNFLRFMYVQSRKKIKILVTLRGDMNGDRIVNMKDVYFVIKAFASMPGDPNWSSRADVNKDGIVNMKDIYILITNFGKTWSP